MDTNYKNCPKCDIPLTLRVIYEPIYDLHNRYSGDFIKGSFTYCTNCLNIYSRFGHINDTDIKKELKEDHEFKS